MGMKYPQEFLWFVSSFLCPAGAVEGDGAEPFGVSDNVAECPRMQRGISSACNISPPASTNCQDCLLNYFYFFTTSAPLAIIAEGTL